MLKAYKRVFVNNKQFAGFKDARFCLISQCFLAVIEKSH